MIRLFSFFLFFFLAFSARAQERHTIELTGDDFSDLQFLKQYIGEKRIVQLGESGHGMAEYFILKTRLVRFLHAEMNFDVLAIEGGLGDVDASFQSIAELTDTAIMRNSFYQTWAFSEAVPLFSYVKKERFASDPLIIAGFDNISTSGYLQKQLATSLGRNHAVFTAFESAEERSNQIMKGTFKTKEEAIPVMNEARAAFELLLSQVKKDKKELIKKLKSEKFYAVFTRVLQNRIATLNMKPSQLSRQGMESIRDSLMASNVEWICNELYPGKKVIVWAHNGHVAKAYGSTTFNGKHPEVKRQGEYFNERMGSKAYTIGLYCNTGRAYAYFIKNEYDLTTPVEGSLEARLVQPGTTVFTDITSALKTPEGSWLGKETVSYEWGRNQQLLVPKDQYDAVIVIDKITPPHRLNDKTN